jgi:hypothetical protein
MLLVAGNQRRVGLGDKMLGKVERTGGHGDHVIISDIEMRSRAVVAGRSVCRRDELVRPSAANNWLLRCPGGRRGLGVQ